jgi:hypothetical protein
MRLAARKTVRYFEAIGALDDDVARAEFEKHQLLEDENT